MDQNCLRCRQLLSEAMDGEATQNELAFVQQHLISCQDCREAQAAFQSIRNRFQHLNQPVPPPQLRMAVMSSIGGQGRAVPLGRKRRYGTQPFLSFSQKMAIGTMAGVVLLLGSLLVWGIMRTPAFEVIDQQANLADQKVVLTFSQPVDQLYIMSHFDLFEVKDQQGNLLPIAPQNIKVQDDGKKVELTIPDGSIAPGATDVQLDVKPDLKSNDGKKLTNPGPKEASVVGPAPANATRTNTPRPAQATVKPTATRVPTTAPVRSTDPATVADDTPLAVPTSTALPVAKPTVTRAVTTTPVQRPTITPSLTISPTLPVSTTVAPQTTVVSTTPQVSPVVSGTIAPVDTTPVVTTAGPTTAAPTTPSQTTVVPSTTVAVTTALADLCKLSLYRGFEVLYNNRSDVAARIGCPLADEAQAGFTYQPFQRGFMLLHRQTGLVYIFYSTSVGSGSWVKMRDPGPATPPPANTVAPGGTAAPVITPTATPATGCSLIPERAFGNIWLPQPTVRNAIGCPVATESQVDQGTFQPFDKGLMFFSPTASNGRRVYVLFNDTSYIDVPDAFQG